MPARHFDVAQRHAWQGQKVDPHAHKNFVVDEQAAFGQQPVHIGNASVGGIFHRKHGKFRRSSFHRRDDIFKCRAGKRLMIGPGGNTGFVRIGAEFSLEGDFLGHLASPEQIPRKRSFRRAIYTLHDRGGRD